MDWTSTRGAMRRHLATFGALLAQFSPAHRKRAAQAYRGGLLAGADDRMKAKLEAYADAVLDDPRSLATDAFDPAEIVPLAVEALGRRVGDADREGPRMPLAQLDAEEPDYTEEELAAAVAAAVKEAKAAATAVVNARMLAIAKHPMVKGHEREAFELALLAPDMDPAAVVDMVFRVSVPRTPTIAERFEKAYPGVGGLALCLGGPTEMAPGRTSDAVIERINKQNGFAGSNGNPPDAADRGGKSRYRMVAPSVGALPEIGDASNKQNFQGKV